MIIRAQLTLLITLLTALSHSPSLFADTPWLSFRGDGNGRADTADVAVEWSENSNVRWKTEIPGKGWSSPVVWGQQIWLTTASEDGTKMYAICINRDTGKIEHKLLVFENPEPRFCHPTNSYASPTPTIEDGRVYVHFGSYGTACLDTTSGKVIWERRDFECNHWRGPGASPIISEGRLFVPFDGYDHQFVVALDTTDGSTIWRKDRNIDYGSDNGDHKKAYCTCSLVEHNGRLELISPSAAEVVSYDPASGDEYWRVRYGGMNSATRPLIANGLVYVTNGDSTGKIKPSLVAIRPGGNGNVTESHVVWNLQKGVTKRPSPLVIDDLLFLVGDDGVATCVEANTGEVVWRKRIGGSFRSSPVYAQGRIYCFDLDGACTVIEAGREFKQLATNELDHGCQASPAISGNDLFVRTTQYLYCIEP